MMHKYIFILLLLLVIPIRAQEANIVSYLKQIEAGDKESVVKVLPDLKKKNPGNPSIIFLEGIVTEDAPRAASLFNEVITKHPRSQYADASVFRLSSYYNILGDDKKALFYAQLLKKNYSSSPYIKLITPITAKKRDPNEKEVPVKLATRYTIQAGAFGNKVNAEALKKQFEDAGFYSEIKPKTIAGTTFQIVYAGAFNDEEEARNFLGTINKQFKLDGRVVSKIE